MDNRKHVEQLVCHEQDLRLCHPTAEAQAPLLQGFADQKFGDEEYRTILGDIVVENPDRTAVSNRVR